MGLWVGAVQTRERHCACVTYVIPCVCVDISSSKEGVCLGLGFKGLVVEQLLFSLTSTGRPPQPSVSAAGVIFSVYSLNIVIRVPSVFP